MKLYFCVNNILGFVLTATKKYSNLYVRKRHPDVNVVSRSKLQTTKPTKYVCTNRWLYVIKRGIVASNVIVNIQTQQQPQIQSLLALLKFATGYAQLSTNYSWQQRATMSSREQLS
uniref:Uncharacterized protein n=1 Tax=Glossina pallidipes TaxID=7398 RepID=A0A1A9ZK00_GLOPL